MLTIIPLFAERIRYLALAMLMIFLSAAGSCASQGSALCINSPYGIFSYHINNGDSKTSKTLSVLRVKGLLPLNAANLIKYVLDDIQVEPVEKLGCIVIEANQDTIEKAKIILRRIEKSATGGEVSLAVEILSIIEEAGKMKKN